MECEWKENDSYVAPIINDALSVFRCSSSRSVIKTVQCSVRLYTYNTFMLAHRIYERHSHMHAHIRIALLPPSMSLSSSLLPLPLLLLADTLESTLSNEMHDTHIESGDIDNRNEKNELRNTNPKKLNRHRPQ